MVITVWASIQAFGHLDSGWCVGATACRGTGEVSIDMFGVFLLRLPVLVVFVYRVKARKSAKVVCSLGAHVPIRGTWPARAAKAAVRRHRGEGRIPPESGRQRELTGKNTAFRPSSPLENRDKSLKINHLQVFWQALAKPALSPRRTKRRGRHPDKALSAAFVRSAPPGRHADGNGLYLFVQPTGTRSWVQLLVIRDRVLPTGKRPCRARPLAPCRGRQRKPVTITPSRSSRNDKTTRSTEAPVGGCLERLSERLPAMVGSCCRRRTLEPSSPSVCITCDRFQTAAPVAHRHAVDDKPRQHEPSRGFQSHCSLRRRQALSKEANRVMTAFSHRRTPRLFPAPARQERLSFSQIAQALHSRCVSIHHRPYLLH